MPILGLTCLSPKGDKNKMFSEMKILQCIQNEEVIKFNDVIRSAHCVLNMALNIESEEAVSILTFEWKK